MASIRGLICNRFYSFLSLVSGAIPGALLRWQIGNDFLVNIIGSAILGFFFGVKLNKKYYLILVVGFCGSFTTFSGWMADLLNLLSSNNLFSFFHLLAVQLFLAFVSAFLGFFLGRKLFRQSSFDS